MSIVKLKSAKVIKIPFALRSYKLQGEGEDGFIEGQVLEKGLPVSRQVMCYHRQTGLLIKKIRSNDSGYFRFDGLASGIKVFITSIDDNGDSVQHKAVTGDFITVLRTPLAGEL